MHHEHQEEPRADEVEAAQGGRCHQGDPHLRTSEEHPDLHWHPQVLDLGDAGHPCDVSLRVLREHLGLGLVEPQVPHAIEALELLDGLGHLWLGVGQDEHVISKGQEVASVHHVLQLLGLPQRLLEVHIEQHG